MGKPKRQQNNQKNSIINQSKNRNVQSDSNAAPDNPSNMMDKKAERSQYVYELVNKWIENADNKVSVSCGIFTGAFGVITFLSERITSSVIVNDFWRTVYQCCFGISLLLMFASILFYVLAINPNLGSSGRKKNKATPKKRYPIFYGDISKLNLEDYKNTINRALETDFVNELQDEIHYNAGICIDKMRRYRVGLWLSFLAIAFALGSWAAHYLMVH